MNYLLLIIACSVTGLVCFIVGVIAGSNTPEAKMEAKRIIDQSVAKGKENILVSESLVNPESGLSHAWLYDEVVNTEYEISLPPLEKPGLFDDSNSHQAIIRERKNDHLIQEHKKLVISFEEAQEKVRHYLNLAEQDRAWAKAKRVHVSEQNAKQKARHQEQNEREEQLNRRDIDESRLRTFVQEAQKFIYGDYDPSWRLGCPIYKSDDSEWVSTKEQAVLFVIRDRLDGEASVERVWAELKPLSDAAEALHHERITKKFVEEFLRECESSLHNLKKLPLDGQYHLLIPVNGTGKRCLFPFDEGLKIMLNMPQIVPKSSQAD